MEQLKEDNMKRLKVIKRSFASYIWLHSTPRIKKDFIGDYQKSKCPNLLITQLLDQTILIALKLQQLKRQLVFAISDC